MWCNGPTNAGKPLAPATPAPRPVAASKPAAVVTTAARPAAYRLVAFISKTLPSDGRCLHPWARAGEHVGSVRGDSPAGNNYRHREPGPGQRRTYGYKGQGWRRWGVARRGGLALAVCASGLLLSAPAGRAASRISHAPPGLPGPRPGCSSLPGVAAPAAEPWAQQALRF